MTGHPNPGWVGMLNLQLARQSAHSMDIPPGNWGAPAAVTTLLRALSDVEPLVRGHAAWALGQIESSQARSALSERLSSEDDAWVKTEISAALQAQDSSGL